MKLSCVSFLLAMMASTVVGNVADAICANASNTKNARDFCYKAVAIGCHEDNTKAGCAHRQRLFEKKSGTTAPWLSWTPPAVEEEVPPPELCFTGTADYVFEQCKLNNANCCNSANATDATDHTFACGGWGGTWADDSDIQVEVEVCANSCNGLDSCKRLHKDTSVKSFSCNGFEACYEVGYESRLAAEITIEANSCIGDLSCKWVGYTATNMRLGPNACHGGDDDNGKEVCAYTSEYSEDNTVMIGEGSCIGERACRSVQQWTDGDIHIDQSACNGKYACAYVAGECNYKSHRDIRNVEIAMNACNGFHSCYSTGGDANNVVLSVGACSGGEACKKAGVGATSLFIGPHACGGSEACFETAYNVTTVTIEAEACRVNDDTGRSCAELARNADHLSNVTVGEGACFGDGACEFLASDFDSPAVEGPEVNLYFLEILADVCVGDAACGACLTGTDFVEAFETTDIAARTAGACDENDFQSIVLTIDRSSSCEYSIFDMEYALRKREDCDIYSDPYFPEPYYPEGDEDFPLPAPHAVFDVDENE